MTKPKQLDLTKAEDCRTYIDNFELPQGKIQFVDLSDGKKRRRVWFHKMSDEDAITIANDLYRMEMEATMRVKDRIIDEGGMVQ
jgi:hypothetical protein